MNAGVGVNEDALGCKPVRAVAGNSIAVVEMRMVTGSCCVDFELEVDAKFDLAFLEALIAKVRNDEQSILRALRDDVGVGIDDDITKLENISRTDAQFPFVMHIACDSCLGSTTSPSAILNVSYEELALKVDLAFHDLTLQVRALSSRLRVSADDHTTNEQILAEMDRLHRVAYPSVQSRDRRPPTEARR
jgi:hypothetical protein